MGLKKEALFSILLLYCVVMIAHHYKFINIENPVTYSNNKTKPHIIFILADDLGRCH